MASTCIRGALGLQRASNATQNASRRAFTQSTFRSKQLPSFIETSNEELNNVLATLRTKHFIPKYLSKPERKLIQSPNNKQYLEENPQTAQIGEEEIELEWIDVAERPSAVSLCREALRLIVDSEGNSWENLPRLLRAMAEPRRRGKGTTPLKSTDLERIVRKAVNQHKLPVIFRCLQPNAATGMSVMDRRLLRALIVGVRRTALRSNWEKNHVAVALERFQEIMSLLESEGGKYMRPGDPRKKPEMLGALLELAAVYAYKHGGGEDTNGVVKTYADRLLSILETNPLKYNADTFITIKDGTGYDQNHDLRYWSFMLSVPIYHGLLLAEKVLGNSLPRSDTAKIIISQYEARLESLASEIELRKNSYKRNAYEVEALEAWNQCIRK
ncbi:uncharacterized protein MYCFIDRAFT_60507 [Pseudocercospora fijiensis CIRAD86]|uniref:Uncharacterized protein n=1 Tax=Pseudocercospora fijiensis (strain CIRAD86) TaxID=383855 RepID=M2ZTC6_PSEFD|nr:uncharacterized protein MYCFIDRAFT_60507 [Pseudocercospora fijiensis CIRAD86]EME82264.1 hypothetical protein MYCFIDRAFT_60507 [Pseudocercospora fijiensis CIRAD86]